jgi:trimeric autotransporter adhesin
MNRTLGFALLATATLAVSAAFAQSSTKAGTQIQNQASATYTDSSGRPQVATSNLAVTVVQQVYGVQVKPDKGNAPSASSNFTLLPDPINDKQGVPSSSVSFSYTVTNTGNDIDSYNLLAVEQAIGLSPAGDDFDFVAGSIKIYQDNNANGQYDPGEPEITSALSIAGGGSTAVVVVATVPGPSATVANGKVARLDLSATSVGDITKKDNNNIAKLAVINDASLSLVKTATGPDATGNISYSLTGSNVGSQTARSVVNVATIDPGATTLDGILIADPLPAGTTLVAGSAAGSAGGLGISTVVYHISGGNWTKTQPATISTVDQIGLLLEDPNSANDASENTLNVSAGYSLTFKVLIGNTLLGGADVANTATVKYDRQTTVAGLLNTSNTTHTTVPVTKGVAISTGTAVAPIATGSETQTATGTIAAGQTITFTNKMQNTGNVDDTFQVSVASYTCTPATGYNIQLFQSDGVSPLSSIISLTKGAIYNVFVKVTIPGTALVGNTCTVNLSATSTTDVSKTDPTTDTLTVTQAANVLFGHSDGSVGPAATTVNTIGVTTTGNPNSAVSFPMDVVNKGGSTDSFNLIGNIVFNLVGGGTSNVAVKYYPASADTGGGLGGIPDGILDATEIGNSIAISNTGSVSSNAEVKVFAVVSIPVNAIAATGVGVNQSVASPTTGVSASFNLEKVTINTIYGLNFTPNGSGTTTSPGTLVYSHALKNTGNSNVATTNLSWTNPSGFTYVLYQDNGSTVGAIDAGDTVITSGANFTLNAGATMPILVQVTTANGLTSGVSDARVITANAGTANATVTDTTSIVAGELQLTKAASTATAQPRTYLVQSGLSTATSEITYTINAKNVGTASLTNVIVFDSIPNFTDFKFDTITVTLDGVACTTVTCPIEYSTDGGTTWVAYTTGVGGTKASLDVPAVPSANSNNSYSDDATRITNIRISKVGSFTPSQTVVITFTVSVR